MTLRTPPQNQTNLAYSIPAPYANYVSFTYLNGVFRVTFFEQNLQSHDDSPELAEVLVPRVAVVLTPGIFAELLKSGGELYNHVAQAMKDGTAATPPASSAGSTLQ